MIGPPDRKPPGEFHAQRPAAQQPREEEAQAGPETRRAGQVALEAMSGQVNRTKALLSEGKIALGMGLRQARTVDIATVAGTCGFDWLFIDTEHSSMDLDRKSTRLNSSHSQISYAVFCLKKKNNN